MALLLNAGDTVSRSYSYTQPSPLHPSLPEGTGERTGNVMPAGEQKTIENNGITFSSDGKGKYSISGTATAYASARFNLLSPFTSPISVSNGGRGTLSFFNTQADNNVTFVFYNGATKVDDWKQTPSNRVSTAYNAIGNKYVDNIVITVVSGATVDITITPEFTNDGVIPESFEKYGYKIPISSASTTTPVYLGEVESTRRIKKLVLTGKETISGDIQYNRFLFTIQDMRSEGVRLTKLFCTHYQNISDGRPIANVPNNSIYAGGGTDAQIVFIKTTDYTTDTDFKSYLAAQYAAGTPVTIWYVLATPETAVVNEPIRKIGEYADSVSGITIPTISGKDTVDVLTTLKPSEVSLSYTGWHDASAKEWDGSEWQ